jgi:protein phosphatase
VTTIIDHYAYTANVGDSRLYLLGDELRQITKDHSLVEEMVRLGEITEAEARNHPDKNIITRAVGATPYVGIDFFDYKVEPGGMILMCSDGLSNMVEDEDIRRILRRTIPIEDKAKVLVETANENGGKDNIAVILVEPDSDEEA